MYLSKWEAFKLASLSGLAEPLGVIIVGMLSTIEVYFSFQWNTKHALEVMYYNNDEG